MCWHENRAKSFDRKWSRWLSSRTDCPEQAIFVLMRLRTRRKQKQVNKTKHDIRQWVWIRMVSSQSSTDPRHRRLISICVQRCKDQGGLQVCRCQLSWHFVFTGTCIDEMISVLAAIAWGRKWTYGVQLRSRYVAQLTAEISNNDDGVRWTHTSA